MNALEHIVAGIRSNSTDYLGDLFSRLSRDDFINAIKNAPHTLYGADRVAFLAARKRFLDSGAIKNPAEFWELTHQSLEFDEGLAAAQRWLKPFVLATPDNWATYLYIKNQLKLGAIEDAREILCLGLARFPEDRKFHALDLLTYFFAGDLGFYDRVPILAYMTDPYFAPVAIRLAFIRRRFTEVIALGEKFGPHSYEIVQTIERARHALAIPAGPDNRDRVPIFVISGGHDTPRMRRFRYAAKPFDLATTFFQGIDARTVPELIKESWIPDYHQINDSRKNFGSFASHLAVWETLAQSHWPGAIICEDDCMFIFNPMIALRESPDQYDSHVLLMNDRMAEDGSVPPDSALHFADAEAIFARRPRTIGADCYYLSRACARAAIPVVKEVRFKEQADGFLVRTLPGAIGIRVMSTTPAPGEHVDEEYFR